MKLSGTKFSHPPFNLHYKQANIVKLVNTRGIAGRMQANKETQKAIEDVENKKGTRVKDSQDLF